MNEINPTSDPIYKRLYSFAEMVADLLRSVLPAGMLEALDLRSLEKVPAAYVGDDFRQRHGDTVWRVRAAGAEGAEGGWAYVLVLLEFQSSNDATMALRVNEYTVMLYRELLRTKAVEPSAGEREGFYPSYEEPSAGHLPPVLPVLMYNGESRWTAARDVRDLIAPTGPFLAAFQPSQRYLLLDVRHAKADYAGKLTSAVALLEQSGTGEDLVEVAGLLAALLGDPDHEEPSAGEREGLAPSYEKPSAGEREGLAPRMKELRRAFADWLWVVSGRMASKKGPAPPPELTLEDARMTLEERVARWPQQWLEEGRQQGKQQGIEQGKRELLRNLAEVRFGAQTAERLFASLRREDAPQRIDAIAMAVVRCETADELLRQASQATPGGLATDLDA